MMSVYEPAQMRDKRRMEMKTLLRFGMVTLALTVVFAGCSKKSPEESAKTESAESQPAAQTETQPTTAATTPPTTPPARQPASRPLATKAQTVASTETSQPSAPARTPVNVPAGTELEVRTIADLNSKENQAGDTFEATLEDPVIVDGQEVIPKGADVAGKVTKAVASGRLKERAELWVTLTSIRVKGRTHDIDTTTTGHKEGSKATRDIVFIGGGAGAGAAIGGAVGGGKGAAIGSAIGAAAGTAGAMMTGQRDVKFPPETVLRFRLERDLKIQP